MRLQNFAGLTCIHRTECNYVGTVVVEGSFRPAEKRRGFCFPSRRGIWRNKSCVNVRSYPVCIYAHTESFEWIMDATPSRVSSRYGVRWKCESHVGRGWLPPFSFARWKIHRRILSMKYHRAGRRLAHSDDGRDHRVDGVHDGTTRNGTLPPDIDTNIRALIANR